LSGVLEIGRQLGVRTIVEGVETAEACDVVREFGADMAQGYYFARPAPLETLVDSLSGAPIQADRSPLA
jgi:EAL domain-containing protein (putative c-di-GMP-specific phosphodiesterase class I)